MSRTLLTLAVIGSCLMFHAPAARSNTHPNAKIIVHVSEVGAATCATTEPSCSEVVAQGLLSPALYWAHVLVVDGVRARGVAGIQFGIDYDGGPGSGVDVFGWTRCATLQFVQSGWPAAGNGALLTWDPTFDCQTNEPGGAGSGVVSSAGYFYMAAYSADNLTITTHPATGDAKVADCNSIETVLEGPTIHRSPFPLGQAAFSSGGTVPGYSPCAGTPPPPLGCSIAGPTVVQTGTTGHLYAAQTTAIGPSYNWSISGNGTISGSTTASAVVVDAGSAGSFTLILSVQGSNGSGQCTLTVPVTSGFQCSVNGPDLVVDGTVNVYSVQSAPTGDTFAWSVTGNGTITGATNTASVSVLATAPGSFELQATITAGSDQTMCARTVQVNPYVPPIPGDNTGASILLHLSGPLTKNQCSAGLPDRCGNAVANGRLAPADYYFAYVLVGNGYTNREFGSGIAGMQFGIDYDDAPVSGVDVLAWNLCADLQFPNVSWPAANTGNLVVWDAFNNCQQEEPGGFNSGVMAAGGYFYVGAYDPDVMAIIPRPVDGLAKVSDCQSAETILQGPPSPLGQAAFSETGTTPGYVPCSVSLPVVPTTWSRIKSMH